MLKSMLRTVGSVCVLTAFGAVNASASCLLGLICLGGGSSGGGSSGGGSSGGGSTVAAPEIDVSNGLAAAALLVCIGLVLRERFLRARA